MVLQVMDARDISSPKRASGSSGRRMLRLDLTDGDATVVAVEYRELTSVEDASALAPGTKVAVPPGVRIRCQSGILLAHGDVLRVLGGKVAALAEEWEGGRAVAVFAGTDAESREEPTLRGSRRTTGRRRTRPWRRRSRDARRRTGPSRRPSRRRGPLRLRLQLQPRAPRRKRSPRRSCVPRRRPALPPTRAQRAAAQAAGVKLPPPGAPMPSTPEKTATGRTVEPEGVPATSPGRSYIAQEVKEAIPSPVPPPERGGRADSGVARGPPPGFRARAAPEDEATAPIDPPPAPAPAFTPTVTEEDRRSRLLSRFAPDSREGRGSRDRGREDRGRGDRDRDRGDRDRGRGGRGGRGEVRGGGRWKARRRRRTRRRVQDLGPDRFGKSHGGRRGSRAAASERARARGLGLRRDGRHRARRQPVFVPGEGAGTRRLREKGTALKNQI